MGISECGVFFWGEGCCLCLFVTSPAPERSSVPDSFIRFIRLISVIILCNIILPQLIEFKIISNVPNMRGKHYIFADKCVIIIPIQI
mgnify:CR=1 FL=1